jgi:hypothetical protein
MKLAAIADQGCGKPYNKNVEADKGIEQAVRT